MPVFIVCSLLVCFLVQNESPYLVLLESPSVLAIGAITTAASIIGALLKKMPSEIWYDLFASGTLLVWFAYWRQLFNDDAPMFYFFPLYYTLLTAIVTLLFINRSEYFDDESIAQLRFLERNARMDTSAIVVFVLISLVVTRHYLLYPIAMTLFVLRFMLTRCLEIAGR